MRKLSQNQIAIIREFYKRSPDGVLDMRTWVSIGNPVHAASGLVTRELVKIEKPGEGPAVLDLENSEVKSALTGTPTQS